MKHTPGPWETKFEEAFRIKDIKGNTVCIVTHLTRAGRRGPSESEANAYLIATAPELLENLESRYAQTRCGCGHPACNRCEDDRETEIVLNKAKGGGEWKDPMAGKSQQE